MANITAADVAKLRKMTGAGMMDCKNALVESNGNVDEAIKIIREKGKAIAVKRAGREAGQGVGLAKITPDGKRGVIVVLNCETDFVAQNQDFINTATKILDYSLGSSAQNLDALKEESINGQKVSEVVMEFSGITGEKMELSYFDYVNAAFVVPYIHPGNKVASIVGFNKVCDLQVGKDVAMQIAAMSPVAIDKDDVAEDIKNEELEVGRKQAIDEGKPENMVDKIAEGKLQKFYKEKTLLNQEFIKDSKMNIRQYLQSIDKELTVVGFKRVSLSI